MQVHIVTGQRKLAKAPIVWRTPRLPSYDDPAKGIQPVMIIVVVRDRKNKLFYDIWVQDHPYRNNQSYRMLLPFDSGRSVLEQLQAKPYKGQELWEIVHRLRGEDEPIGTGHNIFAYDITERLTREDVMLLEEWCVKARGGETSQLKGLVDDE